MGLVIKIQCPLCKIIYAADTLEIYVQGISAKCQKCNSLKYIARVPVLDAQLCPTCGYMKYTQAEKDTSQLNIQTVAGYNTRAKRIG